MKAAIVHRFDKPLRIEQVAIPEPGPGGQIEGRIVLSQL
jgi:D-arabinose 1-dehydrogenase-like Zn-dependent alcohol dehydrogenase